MPDELDYVQDMIDRELTAQLHAHKSGTREVIAETGYCLNEECEEETTGKWCDAACRDMWQDQQNRRSRQRLTK
jgi:hypothetical protein